MLGEVCFRPQNKVKEEKKKQKEELLEEILERDWFVPFEQVCSWVHAIVVVVIRGGAREILLRVVLFKLAHQPVNEQLLLVVFVARICARYVKCKFSSLRE